MGLFDRFKKKQTKTEERISPADQTALEPIILEIANIISNDDTVVMEKVRNCASGTEEDSCPQEHYRQENQKQSCEKETNDFQDLIEKRWEELVDILEDSGYVCIRDWKDEKEDFVHFLEELKGFKSLGLSVNAGLLREEGYIGEWSGILDKSWEEENVKIAAIDIGSDDYVLFPCKASALEKLKDLSMKIGKRIDLAKDM